MPEIRLAVPLNGRRARTYPAWLEWPAHLIPYRFRRIHQWWAEHAGFFWKPCPLCGQNFGGHEWREIRSLPASVPDPTQPPPTESGPFTSVGICPRCTAAGRGRDPW